MQTNAANKTAFQQTAGYYAAFLILGLTGATMGPSLPSLANQVSVSLGAASILFSARALGYLLGSFQAGRLVDRLPGNCLLAGMLVLFAILMALIPAVPALWLLAGVLLLMGAAEGTLDLSCNTFLVWVHRANVGPFMNGLHFCFGIGAFLAPIVIAQSLLRSGGIGWGYAVLALFILPFALWNARLPGPVPIRAEVVEERGGPSRPLFILLITTVLFLYVGAEVSFGSWIYTYALQQLQTISAGAGQAALESTAALLTSAFWGAFSVGRLSGIPMAIRFPSHAILVADLAGSMVAILILLAFPTSLVALWAGTLGAGLFMASLFPVTITLAEHTMPITGRVTRWFFTGVGAGGMFFPWFIGQLFESTGPQVTMITILVILAFDLIALGGLLAAVRNTAS